MTFPSHTRFLISIFFWILTALSAAAQNEILSRLLQNFDNQRSRSLQEKLYVHTDRSTYVAGETMWLSIYYMDGSFHTPLDISKVAYIEILDKDGKPVAQTKVELRKGGHGSLFLSPVIGTGTYFLRAYTRWMKNSSQDFYFHKTITIINTFRNPSPEGARTSALAPEVKFFPEGGNLIQGLKSKIAVKAVDPAGKFFNFTGALLNHSNDTVAHFRSFKFGMGHFYFTPQPHTNYRAVIRDASGKFSTLAFPKALEQGYTMILAEKNNNQLEIAVNAAGVEGVYVYLISHTRQVINHAASQKLINGQAIFTLDKNKLGEGISHITIFEENGKPVCERLFFKNVERRLIVKIKPDQESYGFKKKITIDFATQDHNAMLVPAALSVSVFRTDSLETSSFGTISDYVWLTSELKGFIESPGYYFNADGPEVIEAVDNLMLTQGWRRFRWADVMKDTIITSYLPEFRGHLIRGKVFERATGALAGRITTLLSSPGIYGRVYGSISNQQGEVQYEMKGFYGTKRIIAEINQSNDSLFRVELNSPFSDSLSYFRYSGFVLDKQWKASLASRSLHTQLLNAFHDYKNDRPVTKNISDTIPFYGTPDERYYLDDYTRFNNMEDVMREYVKGVWVRKLEGKFVFILPDNQNRLLIRNPLVLVDGVPADVDKVMIIDPLKIKRVDVIMKKYYYGQLIFPGVVNLTSYKGDMAGLTLSTYIFSALYDGLQEYREFYSPRYDNISSNQNRIPDFRDLLYWAPRVNTDSNGKATLEFYSSEQEGNYMIVVQGMTEQSLTGGTTTLIHVHD